MIDKLLDHLANLQLPDGENEIVIKQIKQFLISAITKR